MKYFDVQLSCGFEADSKEEAVRKFIYWMEQEGRSCIFEVRESGTLGGYPREFERVDAMSLDLEG